MNALPLVGDCRSIPLPDESVDAVVTDPPYGLNFMNRAWDHDVPGPDYWREVYRVMKPGAHLLAFGGTRTWHWLTVGIEEAGFEIRDCLSWNYATGFPKSHNFGCDCDGEQDSEHRVRQVRGADLPKAEHDGEERGQILLAGVQEQGASARREQGAKSEPSGPEQPSVERRGHVQAPEGELQAREDGQVPGRPTEDGAGERIHTGASSGDGPMGGPTADQQGNGASQESRQPRQSSGEPGAVAEQREPQAGGSGKLCPRCGKPRGFQGWGTALKPAWEPIVLAMKPTDGTFAENALTHGVAGLNVDGCRLGGADGHGGGSEASDGDWFAGGGYEKGDGFTESQQGRWPANVTLSHSQFCIEPEDEDGEWTCPPSCPVRQLDEQSGDRPSASSRSRPKHDATSYHLDDDKGTRECRFAGDTGGASRFYFTSEPYPRCAVCGCELPAKQGVSNSEPNREEPCKTTPATSAGRSSETTPAIGPGNTSTAPNGAWGRASERSGPSVSIAGRTVCPRCEIATAQNRARRRHGTKNRDMTATPYPGTDKILSWHASEPENGIKATRRNGSELSPEARRIVPTPNLSHASGAVRRTPTATTKTTTSRSKSPGFAGPATSRSTRKNTVAGAKNFPSRFRYCAKASRSEREAGLDGFDRGRHEAYGDGREGVGKTGEYKERRNKHPTVKPIDLCRWLVRLVTRKGHLVLDPFMGSGSVGCAALQERRRYIGLDLEPEYVEIARARLEHWAPKQVDMFRDTA